MFKQIRCLIQDCIIWNKLHEVLFKFKFIWLKQYWDTNISVPHYTIAVYGALNIVESAIAVLPLRAAELLLLITIHNTVVR